MNVEFKIARLRAEVTQTELAQIVGMHQPVLSLIENGYLIPKEEKAQAIAKVLGVPPEVICSAENKCNESSNK